MEKIKQLFLDFIDTYGIKEEELNQEGGYSGTLGHYSFLKEIFKTYAYVVSGEYEKAIFQFKTTIDEIDFKFDPTEMSDEQLAKVLERRDIVKEVKQMYEEIKEDIYSPLIDIVQNHEFFSGETIDQDEVPADILLIVSEWLAKGYLKKYVLKQGSAEIPKQLTNFVVSKELYLSDNINYFLNNFNKTYDDDVVRVTAFFKIEKVVDYSYFMFIINYKDHTIAYSDLLMFDNPHMVTASRSPRRKVENKQESGWLPYGIIDRLDSIRKNDKTLARLDNDAEFHKLPWKNFSQAQRLFSLLVIQHLVENLSAGEAKMLMSSEDYVNQKLLEGAEVVADGYESKDFDGGKMKKSNEKLVKDLLRIHSKESTSNELVKVSYDLITKHEAYDSSMLATPEILDKHSQWYAVHEQKKQILDVVGTPYNGWVADVKQMNKHKAKIAELHDMLQANVEKIVSKLVQAENLYMEIDPELLYRDHDTPQFLDFYLRERKKEDSYIFSHTWIGSKIGWYPKDVNEEACPILPQYKGTSEFIFRIKHYSQLMYLLDCKREDLPKHYQCYMYHGFAPGCGNTILNNINPLETINDPCSRENPNGLDIKIFISKRGYNKLVKEAGGKNRPKKLALMINGDKKPFNGKVDNTIQIG